MKYIKKSVDEYLKEIASQKPMPGGGSAAACGAGLSIALSLMVARIIMKKLSPKEKTKNKKVIEKLAGIQRNVVKIIDSDPKVYMQVIKAYKMPKSNTHRARKINRALINSFEEMKKLAVLVLRAHQENRKLFHIARGAIVNDLCVSEAFLKTAFSAAIATASLNAEYITDAKQKKLMLQHIQNIDLRKLMKL